MGRERIDIRVDPLVLEELEAIAERNGIEGRSAAVREAIYHYVDTMKHSWNSQVVTVNIPNRVAERTDKYIRAGEVLNIDQAVSEALKSWCSGLDDEYTGRRKAAEEAVDEKIRNDRSMAKMKQTSRRIAKR